MSRTKDVVLETGSDSPREGWKLPLFQISANIPIAKYLTSTREILNRSGVASFLQWGAPESKEIQISTTSWQFEVVCGLSYVSPTLRRLLFPMKLFSVFKKKPRHGQASVIATDVPTLDTSQSSHPVDSEVLWQGKDPITAE